MAPPVPRKLLQAVERPTPVDAPAARVPRVLPVDARVTAPTERSAALVAAGRAMRCGVASVINRSFVRFALVGLANTVVGYGLIMLLHYGFGAGLVLANVCGYLTGALMSYALNRSFTFASDGPHAQTLPRFGIAVGVCFGLNLLVLKFCISVLALPVAAAQALAMGTYTVAFYLISRYLVFRS